MTNTIVAHTVITGISLANLVPSPANCSGLHSSAGWLALITLNWLTLAEIIVGIWLTLCEPRLMLHATGLHLSALAHASWD